MKTVIITGATSGLGYETAKKIAKDKNYEVILACRNKEKANKCKQTIEKETNNQNIKTFYLDTSSLESVRNFTEEIKKQNKKIDALICNAGISPMHEGITKDGFELVFETNYLGHFLLTNLLLPYMNKNAKIINVTSDMHNPPGGLIWQDPQKLAHPETNDRRKYSYSKLCNIYFTYELNKRLRKINTNITVNAFNPGMMMTNFSGGHNSEIRTKMIKLTMPERVGDLETSSDALSKLVLDDNYKETGKYYDRSTNYIKSSDLSYNEENMLDLWNKSVTWTNLKKEETLEGLL